MGVRVGSIDKIEPAGDKIRVTLLQQQIPG